MDFRRLQQFHFTVYSIMNMITAFSILLQLHGILLITLMNQKTEQQTVLNVILCNRRRTIRKIKMAKRKNLNKKKTCWYKTGRRDLWWEYFVSAVTPKRVLEEKCQIRGSFILILYHTSDPIYHQTLIRPTEEYSVDKKVAITLYYLKICETLSMTANSFGIATNTRRL